MPLSPDHNHSIYHSISQIHTRKCLQCDTWTRVGLIYVHNTNFNVDGDASKNHFVCEPYANESLANLPPQCICSYCFSKGEMFSILHLN